VRTSSSDAEDCPYEGAKFLGINGWDENLWEIDIESIEDLQNIILKSGYQAIISLLENDNMFKTPRWVIEIYDECRE